MKSPTKEYLTEKEQGELSRGFSRDALPIARTRAEALLGRLGYYQLTAEDSRLSEEDWLSLFEGFARGAEQSEKAKAEDVLRRLGFERRRKEVASSDREPAEPATSQRKRGPNRKSSVNPTDAEIRRLFANVRALLAVPQDLPKPATFELLIRVLSTMHDVLRGNLFFTNQELQQIRYRYGQMQSALRHAGASFWPELETLVRSFETSDDSPTLETVTCSVSRLIAKESCTENQDDRKSPSSTARDSEEGYLYIRLAQVLGLDLPAVFDRYSQTAEQPSPGLGNAGGHDGNQAIINSSFAALSEMGLSRSEVLKTAIGRLSHYKMLFKKVKKAVSVEDVAGVFRVVRDRSGMAKTLLAVDFFNSLGDIFRTATQRQGVHPFQGETIQDFDPSPRQIGNGEISTGG